MPTYGYKCQSCGRESEVFQSIGSYMRAPQRPHCCKRVMERRLDVVPAMSGLANALAGDRHYEGLRGPNGEDLSSRSKHREFMRRTGLTTVDDFKSDFARAENERTALRNATFQDRELRETITEKVMTAVAQSD